MCHNALFVRHHSVSYIKKQTSDILDDDDNDDDNETRWSH